MMRVIDGCVWCCCLPLLLLALPCSTWMPPTVVTVGCKLAHRGQSFANGAAVALCSNGHRLHNGPSWSGALRMAANAGGLGDTGDPEGWRLDQVRREREELNDQMMEREAKESGLRKRIRASSYYLGGLDARKFFAQFDVDQNGVLDPSEFARLALSTGARVVRPEDLQAIVQIVGKNNEVRMRDFLRWVGVRTDDAQGVPPSRAAGLAAPAAPAAPELASEQLPHGSWSYGDSIRDAEPEGWTFGESGPGNAQDAASAEGQLAAARREFSALRGSLTRAAPRGGEGAADLAAGRDWRSAVQEAAAEADAATGGAATGGAATGGAATGGAAAAPEAAASEAAAGGGARGGGEEMEPLLRLVAPWVDAPRAQVRTVVYVLVTELGVPEDKVVPPPVLSGHAASLTPY